MLQSAHIHLCVCVPPGIAGLEYVCMCVSYLVLLAQCVYSSLQHVCLATLLLSLAQVSLQVLQSLPVSVKGSREGVESIVHGRCVGQQVLLQGVDRLDQSGGRDMVRASSDGDFDG